MSPIDARNVCFAFPPPLTAAASVKELALNRMSRRPGSAGKVTLRDVSFEVANGEVLGLTGANGAGKTTLLRILAGILRPSSGRVVVTGRVSPLIGLGVGFHPELTVTENVVLYSALIGRDPRAAEREVDEIAGWAGISDYVDAPLRTLSTGMLIRLGFSVATHASPDLLLMDEILAVGDIEFQAQATRRLEELVAGGAAVVIASHALTELERLCDRVLWLSHGECLALGRPAEVLGRYRAEAQSVGMTT